MVYETQNWVGDGCYEPANAGLTCMGTLLVDVYNPYGKILDVSHCGGKLSLDVCERRKAPVLASHSLTHAVHLYLRNLPDQRIKAIAETGGVCGTNRVGSYLDASSLDIGTSDLVFRHVDPVVNLVGIDHVDFASDWIVDFNHRAIGVQSPLGQMLFPDDGISVEMGRKGWPTVGPDQIAAALVDARLARVTARTVSAGRSTVSSSNCAGDCEERGDQEERNRVTTPSKNERIRP